ncbi:1,4-dihydroxy-6-naphthoate synthase [Thermosulfuriphilus sp.]
MRLGFSPCPNDTFLLAPLMMGRLKTGFPLIPVIEDVEALNLRAFQGELAVSKLSFHAFCHLLGRYFLLPVGAALGRGVGPLWVALPGTSLDEARSQEVAVPGLYTTATLLLKLYLPRVRVRPMRFDQIIPAILKGGISSGVIIHEGRFVYPRYGLRLLKDLGQWWEEETGLLLPLGGFFVRAKERSQAGRIADLLRQSLLYAWEHPAEVWDYVKDYAQEMDDEVIREHIRTYVNDFTLDLGEEGRQAVLGLVELALEKGLIKNVTQDFWA